MNWLKTNWLKVLGIGITLLVIAVGIITQFNRHGYDIETLVERHESMKAMLVSLDADVEELQLMIERLSVSVGGHSASLYRIESILLED